MNTSHSQAYHPRPIAVVVFLPSVPKLYTPNPTLVDNTESHDRTDASFYHKEMPRYAKYTKNDQSDFCKDVFLIVF